MGILRLWEFFETMGILEDHVNVWGIVGIFWGPWEICPACILQFQFLSYIEALYMLSELSEVLASAKKGLLYKLLEWGTCF